MEWTMVAIYSYAMAVVNERRGKTQPGKHHKVKGKGKHRRNK
jgi:hypothetical protein